MLCVDTFEISINRLKRRHGVSLEFGVRPCLEIKCGHQPLGQCHPTEFPVMKDIMTSVMSRW